MFKKKWKDTVVSNTKSDETINKTRSCIGKSKIIQRGNYVLYMYVYK